MAEKLIEFIHKCKTYSDFQNLSKYLKENEDIIVKWGPQAHDTMIGYLDYAQHSLGILFLLSFKSQVVISDVPAFFAQVTKLVSEGDAGQLSFSPARLSYVSRRFLEECMKAKQPMRAVAVLRLAVNRLRPSPETLTPLHPQFLQACLIAKNYKAAVPLLEQEILYVSEFACTARDLMLYGYYGGMIMLGQKRFAQACRLFETTLTVPAMALSLIMVEAYKKYVLASLLATGAAPSLPKSTSSIVQRNMKVCALPYVELGNAYATHDVAEVGKVIAAQQQAFLKDRNLGLVLQAHAALSRLNVKRLTKTYIKLPAADVAKQCQLESAQEAEQVVARLALQDEVYASIDQRDGMITFSEPEEKYNDTRCLGTLDRHMQDTIWLTKQLRSFDESVMFSSAYLTRLITERSSDADAPPGMAGSGSAGGAGPAPKRS